MNHNDFYLYIESSVGEQEKMMNWNLEVLTEREKKHFHNRIIKQFAQRGCRNSILGGFQDLPGESAKQMLILLWAGSQAGRPLKAPSKMND